MQLNVLGQPLQACCYEPITGYMRDGFCHHVPSDLGQHWICVEVTATFLSYSLSQGNDLSSPRPEFDFPGLQPGDKWCVCAKRWLAAQAAGCAPPVILASCHQELLTIIPLELLTRYATLGTH